MLQSHCITSATGEQGLELERAALWIPLILLVSMGPAAVVVEIEWTGLKLEKDHLQVGRGPEDHNKSKALKVYFLKS